MPDKPAPRRKPDRDLSELLDRAAAIKSTSDKLITQMHELAAEIAEAKAHAADFKAKAQKR